MRNRVAIVCRLLQRIQSADSFTGKRIIRGAILLSIQDIIALLDGIADLETDFCEQIAGQCIITDCARCQNQPQCAIRGCGAKPSRIGSWAQCFHYIRDYFTSSVDGLKVYQANQKSRPVLHFS